MGRRKKLCKENIIDELVAIGFANATDYLFIEGDRLGVRDTGALSPKQAAAICQIEKSTGGIRVKFYDKMKALELLGKELGMFGGDPAPADTSGGLMAAVLPANKPFLAMAGDQKHGTNIEAPLSTIQEAVALVMDDQIGISMGMTQIILPECGVGEMMKLYKKINRYRSAAAHTPQIGDFVVYDWDGSGTGDHIGVVEWVYGKNMTVVEGNYKNAVTRREIKTDSKSILGYCVPDYTALSGEVQTVKDVQQHLNVCYGAQLKTDGIYGAKTQKAIIKALQTELKVTADGIFGPVTATAAEKNVLGKGCRGERVRILQMLLICQGYKLAADGLFGSKTENALRAYQKKTGLAPDGLAGKNTFKKLTMDN